MAKSEVSAEQRVQLAFSLVQKIDWSRLTTEQVQVGIRDEVGEEMTAFVQNGFRVQIGDLFRETGEVAIQIPALSGPTLAELRSKFNWIREIKRDTSPTDVVVMKLGTVLRPDEEQIDGAEYERRIASLTILFGYQQLNWLVENQDEHPAFKALLGQIYVDGPGLVVVGADGGRDFPDLARRGGRWYLYWDWVRDGLGRCGRVAVSGK